MPRLLALACSIVLMLVLGGMALADASLPLLDKLVFHSQPEKEECLRLASLTSLHSSKSVEPQGECEVESRQKEFQLKLSYAQQKWYNREVEDLDGLLNLGNAERNLVRSLLKWDLLGKQLGAEFDLGYSPATGLDPQESQWQPGLLARMGLNGAMKGEWERLHYWAEYSFFGKEFSSIGDSSPQDHSGGKFGWEVDLGVLTPHVEVSRFYDNVEGDESTSRTLSSHGRVSLDLHVPAWPLLTLTYERQNDETRSGASGPVEEEISSNTISGELSHEWSVWEASITSGYSLTEDRRYENSDSARWVYSLGGAYLPTDAVGITSSLDYIKEFDGSQDVQTETRSATLGGSFLSFDTITLTPNLGYTQVAERPQNTWMETFSADLGIDYPSEERSLTLSLYGSYEQSRDSPGYVDTQSLALSLGIQKGLGQVLNLPHREQTLSINLNHNKYIDNVFPQEDSMETSVLLFLKIVP